MRLTHGHWKRGERTPVCNLRGVPFTIPHILLECPGYGVECQTFHSEILSFRTLSIVLVLKNKLRETRRFGNWICFRHQVQEKTYSVGSLERASPNHWSENSIFLIESGNSIFLKVIHHRQNPIVTTQTFHLRGDLRDSTGNVRRNVPETVGFLHGAGLTDLFNWLRLITFLATLYFHCYFMIPLFHIRACLLLF
jgi:hypothetical protein